MIDNIEENILQTGSTKINLGKTFFKVNSVTERALDHLYCNKPEKLSNIEVIKEKTSDHYPVSYIRNTKQVICKPKQSLLGCIIK